MAKKRGIKVIKQLLGGMDKNTAEYAIAPNNYIDALDIIDKDSTNPNANNIKQLNNNNKLAYNIGTAELTKKKYHYKIILTDVAGTYAITFKIDKLGSITTNTFTEATSATDVQDEIDTLFGSYIDLGAQFSNVVISGRTIDADIELDYYENLDWTLAMSITDNASEITLNTLTDAISAEKVGDLIPIKFKDFGFNQCVWATTGNKEEEKAIVDIQYQSDISSWGFLGGEFDYIDGESVFIYGSGGFTGNISQSFTINYDAPYWAISKSTNPITSDDIFAGGEFTVVRYKDSLSTIGNASKNANGNWTYIEMLRSNKLNFRTYKQITDAYTTITDSGTNYDWTDALNPIRRLLYKGSIMANGFLTVYNSDAIYDLDTIAEESRLQLGVNTSKVKIKALKTGGKKPEAGYIAFVRFGSKFDGEQTTFSNPSNFTWTHSTALAWHQFGDNTEMALQIDVEQVPLNQFTYAQVVVVPYNNSGIGTGYTLPNINIEGLTEFSVVDTGVDTSIYGTIDVLTEIPDLPYIFEWSKNLLDFNNRIIASNVKLAIPYDLTEWAKTITLTTQTRTMQITNDFAEYQQAGGWLNNGYNSTQYMSNEWMSYMPSETIRVAVRISWANGMPDTDFWIADHYIDPSLTTNFVGSISGTTLTVTSIEKGIILVGQEIQGVASGTKITADGTGRGGIGTYTISVSQTVASTSLYASGCDYTITDNRNPVNVFQKYIEVSNINLDYLLPDGKLLKEVVKDIRFSRTNITQEVLSTGIGIAGKTKDNVVVVSAPQSGNGSEDSDVWNRVAFYSPDLINNGATIKSLEDTDEIIAISPTLQNTGLPVSGQQYTYLWDCFGNTQETVVTKKVIQLIDAANGAINNIFSLKYTNSISSGSYVVYAFTESVYYDSGTLPSNGTGNYDYVEGNVHTFVKYFYTSDPTFFNPLKYQIREVRETYTTITNPDATSTVYNTGCITLMTDSEIASHHARYVLYYKRPRVNPYTNEPINDVFFVLPQDVWYDKYNHTTNSEYKIFGGDCYPQKQYYRTCYSDGDDASRVAQLVGFYSYNRTNGALRSGTSIGHGFPNQSVHNILTENNDSDDYIYNACFTPRYNFKTQKPYNADLLYIDKTLSTVYWSNQRLDNALYGNNRVWKIGQQKTLENLYGAINEMAILLGTSGNNAILMLQERNATVQYFDNTAKLITTSVEAILGTGEIMGTKGTFLGISGLTNKFGFIVGINGSGKQVGYYYDAVNKTINRFGQDGSGIVSTPIASYLQKHTTFAENIDTNNADTPADGQGVLGYWDNQKKEAVWTFRMWAKNTSFNDELPYVVGDIVSSGTFGFENIPILYKCVVSNTGDPLTSASWVKYNEYIDDLHQCFTIAWNEQDNAWKTRYTYLPKIYGQYANNFVSAKGNDVYEHNDVDKNARYYCGVVTETNDDIVFTSGDNKIIGTTTINIASLFGISSLPYNTESKLNEHIGFFLVVGDNKYRITNFLAINASNNYVVEFNKNEPIALGSAKIKYTTCNIGEPFIECVVNETYPRYVNYGAIELNINNAPKRIEYTSEKTQSFNDESEFVDWKEYKHTQIKMDTTNSPTDNTLGVQGVEGITLKEKIVFAPNIENKLISHNTIIVEQKQ